MFINYLHKKESKRVMHKGFTLIELLVASAVFVTAMTLAIEALFAAQHSYAKIDGLRAVMDNLNTSFDLMTRDVRYASIFFCGNSIEDASRTLRQSCPFTGVSTDGGTAIMFRPSGAQNANVRKGYYLSQNKVYEYAIGADGVSTSTLPITGDDVMIDTLRFFVQGANTTAAAIAGGNLENAGGASDNQQPTITIVIAGRAIVSSSKTQDSHFQLQTTVTARHIDI